MKLAKYISLLLIAITLVNVKARAATERVTATLHPQSSAPVGSPVKVSFGMPFPRGFMADPANIRVLDSAGNEIPAHVRMILPWRDITSGNTLPYIRSALIQIDMTFSSRTTPVSIIVEAGVRRRRNAAIGVPVRENWTRVNDHKYPGQYNVYEPVVYVTLPPRWLAGCGIKSRTLPYGAHSTFSWYDSALSNSNPNLNSGMNFFKTATNDDPGVSVSNRINYLTDGSPWLFDRAMSLYNVYLRSGKVEHLRESHRAAYFYAARINSSGFFSLKNGDHKYVYGEGMVTDMILMGDEGHLDAIRRAADGANSWNYTYNPGGGFWTERHFGFTWLAQITAFEATGDSVFASRSRQRANHMFQLQDNPPAHSSHGTAPDTGALMHLGSQHETSWNNSEPWMFSPWMTVFVIDALQRYYQHSGDHRVIRSGQRFGDAVLNYALAWRDFGGSLGRLKVPGYFAIRSGALTSQYDYQHALDVMKILAFAYQCSVIDGSPNQRYRQEALSLGETARKTFEHFIRPNSWSSNLAIYRLPNARTFCWWFRSTADLDYLLNFTEKEAAFPGPVNDATAPYIIVHSPDDGAYSVPHNADITVRLRDDLSGIDKDSVRMYINGKQTAPVITGDSREYVLTYTPSFAFSPGETVRVSVTARDLAPEPNAMAVASFSFTVTDAASEAVKEAEAAIFAQMGNDIKIIGSREGRGTLRTDETALIFFRGERAGTFKCRVFTMSGELVWEDSRQGVSEGAFTWRPDRTESGTYIVHVSGPGFTKQKKAVILR